MIKVLCKFIMNICNRWSIFHGVFDSFIDLTCGQTLS